MDTPASCARGTLRVSVGEDGSGSGKATENSGSGPGEVAAGARRDEFWARDVLHREGFGWAEIQDLSAEDLFELAHEAAGA